MRTLREQLERSRMDAREKAARLDLIAFQLGEIEKAAPKAGEDEELAATKQVLASAERIQRLCEESYAALYESDGAVLSDLGGIWKRVGELAAIDPQFAPYVDARDGIKSQLEDLAFFLRSYADGVDASPGRLQQVEDRLALLERLKRKYGPTLAGRHRRGRRRCAESETLLTGAGERAEDLQQALDAARRAFLDVARAALDAAAAAPQARSRASSKRCSAELAMARTRFEVRFNDAEPGPRARGASAASTQAEFFVSPNPGEELRPLARIVSGGELSRVMLALKTLARRRRRTGKTLIFDEVDAGIGGRVADVVGSQLRALGDRVPGAVHHAPAADRRAGDDAVPDREARPRRADGDVGRAPRPTLDGSRRSRA